MVAGGNSDGVLGLLAGQHGLFGRRSALGRLLPVGAWLLFEVVAAGALALCALSTLVVVPEEVWRKRLAPRARASPLVREPLLSVQPDALCMHYLALAISALELHFNDLPVLYAHSPLVVLLAGGHSLCLLLRLRTSGSFQYMHGAPCYHTPAAALTACLLSATALPGAFVFLAQRSASHGVHL